jgi:serine/threonine-protein kinase RsbW
VSEGVASMAPSAGRQAGSGPAGSAGVLDVVEVRLPPESAYLSVLRTATAGLAARLDFTLDDIEDLRIAVDEACAMLLPHAVEGGILTCQFQLSENRLDVTVSLPTRGASVPERDTFAWTVLTALAGEVDAGLGDDGDAWIALHKRRGV